jgi:hypothetical protein
MKIERGENSSERRELKMRMKKLSVDLFERISYCSKNVNNQTALSQSGEAAQSRPVHIFAVSSVLIGGLPASVCPKMKRKNAGENPCPNERPRWC